MSYNSWLARKIILLIILIACMVISFWLMRSTKDNT